MRRHRLRGSFRIAPHQRIQDLLVLIDRGAGRPRRAREAEQVQMGMETSHRVREQRPPRSPRERVMKLLVQQGEAVVDRVALAGVGVVAHLLDDVAQQLKVRIGRVLRGERRGSRLQKQPHLEQVAQGVRVEKVGRAVAGVRPFDHETLRLEACQSFPYRCRRHIELTGQRLDAHAGPRGDAMVHDHRLDGLIDPAGRHILLNLLPHAPNHRESADQGRRLASRTEPTGPTEAPMYVIRSRTHP